MIFLKLQFIQDFQVSWISFTKYQNDPVKLIPCLFLLYTQLHRNVLSPHKGWDQIGLYSLKNVYVDKSAEGGMQSLL